MNIKAVNCKISFWIIDKTKLRVQMTLITLIKTKPNTTQLNRSELKHQNVLERQIKIDII